MPDKLVLTATSDETIGCPGPIVNARISRDRQKETLNRTMKKLILLVVLTLLNCEIDHGLGPMNSRISGKVTFVNKELKPQDIESLRAVAVTTWDPAHFSLSDVVIANTSINLSREEPEYYIPAPLGPYELVAIVWKKKGQGWNYTHLLGYYGFDPVSFTGENKTVTLSKSHPIAQDVDIVCDWTWASVGR